MQIIPCRHACRSGPRGGRRHDRNRDRGAGYPCCLRGPPLAPCATRLRPHVASTPMRRLRLRLLLSCHFRRQGLVEVGRERANMDAFASVRYRPGARAWGCLVGVRPITTRTRYVEDKACPRMGHTNAQHQRARLAVVAVASLCALRAPRVMSGEDLMSRPKIAATVSVGAGTTPALTRLCGLAPRDYTQGALASKGARR